MVVPFCVSVNKLSPNFTVTEIHLYYSLSHFSSIFGFDVEVHNPPRITICASCKVEVAFFPVWYSVELAPLTEKTFFSLLVLIVSLVMNQVSINTCVCFWLLDFICLSIFSSKVRFPQSHGFIIGCIKQGLLLWSTCLNSMAVTRGEVREQQRVKGVKYKVMEEGLTLGGGRTVHYADHVS